MLKKLLKYDLKNIFKVLIIFYSLSIFFSLLTRVFGIFDNSTIMNIISSICSGAAISMMFSIMFNNVIRLWVNFKTSFYSDEAYLTHTLPIEKKTLYLSQFITSIITLLVSFVVIILSILIAYYSKENIEFLKNIFISFMGDKNIYLMLFVFIVIFYLEMLFLVTVGYTGTILGYRKDNAKVGYSLLFGFIGYVIIQIFILIVLFIIALFNNNIMKIFISNDAIPFNIMKLLCILSIIIYLVIIIINCAINIKLFNKGVNVD